MPGAYWHPAQAIPTLLASDNLDAHRR
jgi:hypothetical protein